MTQAEQEEQLLAKSPEYRRNEMIMLEEFKRRKREKDIYDIKKNNDMENNTIWNKNTPHHDLDNIKEFNQY